MKIIHVSDTHLGKRPRKTRSAIINEEIRPLEDDYYNSWINFVKKITSDSQSRPDLIVHSGDFFDLPSGNDSSPPPDYSRKITAETFKILNEKKIPIVIIDGNHGRYMQFRYSPLSEYPIIFNNVFIYTYFDIKNAIKNKIPLFKDFEDLNTRIHLHPAIESSELPQLLTKYNEWVQIQIENIDPNMINIAVAHGMINNGTLSYNFINPKFDYIALGDNHKMQSVTANAWYAGSTEFVNFGEQDYDRGYLEINIDKNKFEGRTIKKHLLPSTRRILDFDIQINQDETNKELLKKILSSIEEKQLKEKYVYSTAARIKVRIGGEIAYGSSINLPEIAAILNKTLLSTDEYNVVEFQLELPKYFGYGDQSEFTNTDRELFYEYLIEDPEKEFKLYITQKRNEDLLKHNLDPNLLSKMFLNTLKGIK